MIGAGEILERKSTLKKAGNTRPEQTSLPESRSANSSDQEDTADYTGGSYTGEEDTGDSGFGDARPFLKVNIAGSQSTARPVRVGPFSASGSGYYKTLGTPDLDDDYICLDVMTRGNSSADQDQAGGQESYKL